MPTTDTEPKDESNPQMRTSYHGNPHFDTIDPDSLPDTFEVLTVATAPVGYDTAYRKYQVPPESLPGFLSSRMGEKQVEYVVSVTPNYSNQEVTE